jgi:hypothetical protein
MKNLNLYYWIITGLMAAFMLLGATMDILMIPEAVALITHLGYPLYFIPFIGVMKILGVTATLIPRFSKLKEWAYAGLTFDTFGAIYSHLAVGDTADKWLPALLGLILVLGSYSLYTWRKPANS